IHANNAANKKARLAKKIDALIGAANPAPAKTEVKEVAPAAEAAAETLAEEPVKKVRKPRAKKAEEPKAE
ncbi:MAG: hypothetical protein J6Y43_05535, partial [Clostridia bacterium]|nr:hypothetical protein [Clostridia bacterium]